MFNHRLDALNPDFVGGLELGAVPLTAIVIAGSESNHRKGFMVRKSRKGRGGRKPTTLRASKVHRLQQGAASLSLRMSPQPGVLQFRQWKGFGKTTTCEVLAVISILDREEGGVEAFASAGIPFESILTRSDITQ